MNTQQLFATSHRSKAALAFIICLIIQIAAMALGSQVQTDFGKVEVSNVIYENYNGIPVRAKLLRPVEAAPENPMPGVVYIHGYQNNRETSDAYSLELARRGIVVLNIDAIGRGNSGIPNDIDDPDFDETYGGRTSLEYLKSLPYVNAGSVGLLGHSLGAEMVYKIALEDSSVDALVISGFAYNEDASASNPKNMLMIFGKWDEYRDRMTGTRDFEAEWMRTPQTQAVIPVDGPQFGVTYGDFEAGTARRVYMPRSIHIQESHHEGAIAEAVTWIREALQPAQVYWIDAESQIWQIKEAATLVAMLAGFAALLPLGLLLLRTRLFSAIQGPVAREYACTNKEYFKYASINGVLMWLYLPLIFALFGLHVYVVPIDKLFPMMLVNGTVWWFLLINVIGFFIFRGWYKRRSRETGLTLAELGISYRGDRFGLDWNILGLTIMLAAILFLFAYASEHILEQIFIVDYRFVFPFASDLTAYRALMFLIYFPFLLVGFTFLGTFIHGILRRPQKDNWWKTTINWSVINILTLIVPLILFMLIQYIPLFVSGAIPFVGPGGFLANFTMSLFHIIGVLILVTPLSTWFYQLTGKIYLGAILNAALVAWMFTSSQVIAPIPI
ncbi:MAG: alpha/beta hydrolase [Anaerolineales bacterium]|nr:alpha/beta hydrolase [Anaerolineales bacterium]